MLSPDTSVSLGCPLSHLANCVQFFVLPVVCMYLQDFGRTASLTRYQRLRQATTNKLFTFQCILSLSTASGLLPDCILESAAVVAHIALLTQSAASISPSVTESLESNPSQPRHNSPLVIYIIAHDIPAPLCSLQLPFQVALLIAQLVCLFFTTLCPL